MVDDLIMLAARVGATSRQRQQMRAADEDVEAIVKQTHTQPMADRAGGHGVEDFAQCEAAGARHGDDHLLEVGCAALGKCLQMRALDIDALAGATRLASRRKYPR